MVTPTNIFVADQSLELSAGYFNHCSSMCPHDTGMLIGWYGGTGECFNDQSVYLLFMGRRGTSKPFRLGDKTGNPVLWQNGNEAILLYSQFEDVGPMANLADRWKYCSLWLQRLIYDNNSVQLRGPSHRLAKPEEHLLGRCRPVEYNGDYYLPLYDEVARQNVIFKGCGLEWRQHATFGTNIIQATIWPETNKLGSLSRTFKSGLKHAPYAESIDGKTWTEPVASTVKNRNSSLHALYPYLVWNDADSERRTQLTLGDLTPRQDGPPSVDILGVVAAYGAYPTLCLDQKERICLSFTTSTGRIKFYAWSKQRLEDIRGRRDSARRAESERIEPTEAATDQADPGIL